MGQDNQEFINKAKNSLEELAGKTKEIFGDVKDRNEARMGESTSSKDSGSNEWSSQDRKHAAGEFEYQTRNQYQNGVQLDAVPDLSSQSTGDQEYTQDQTSRYSEQQPVSDFTELGAVGGEAAVEEVTEGSRADYGTEAVYGDPTGRYDGSEGNLLSEEERLTRYDEQEPLDDFFDDLEGPGQPRL
ncbi:MULTISPECIES: hypothetical protein [Bhargavaea]|uniref:Uncharacterized protein n=1 Tax=Bhargavaea changchunensis TaxID=2134037 RepID=A0ABW2NIM1_9BACL|nr:hypothetical protein [Bhargavaea sp. CC-171006]